MPGEFIIFVFILIGLILRVSSRTQKVANNRPGQRKEAIPKGTPVTEAPQAMPVRPVQSEPLPVADIPYSGEVLDDTDLARADLTEGDSRECDHGSVGGSMDITSHQGDVNENVSHQRVAISWDDKGAQLISPSRISALDMQRAVVMAEILKSPRERYANRRWPRR